MLLYHYSLHPWEYFTQNFFVPMCTHSMEFDSFYRAGIYGRPCTNSSWQLFIMTYKNDASKTKIGFYKLETNFQKKLPRGLITVVLLTLCYL